MPEEPRPSSSPSWYLESSTHCCGGFGRARRFLKLVWQCWPSEPSCAREEEPVLDRGSPDAEREPFKGSAPVGATPPESVRPESNLDGWCALGAKLIAEEGHSGKLVRPRRAGLMRKRRSPSQLISLPVDEKWIHPLPKVES